MVGANLYSENMEVAPEQWTEREFCKWFFSRLQRSFRR